MSELSAALVFGLLAYVVISLFKSDGQKVPEKICVDCLSTSDGKLQNGGSGCFEIVLWCCFIVPGLLYTVWRRTSGSAVVCPKCGGKLLSLDTPRGQQLWREANPDEARVLAGRARFEQIKQSHGHSQDPEDHQ